MSKPNTFPIEDLRAGPKIGFGRLSKDPSATWTGTRVSAMTSVDRTIHDISSGVFWASHTLSGEVCLLWTRSGSKFDYTSPKPDFLELYVNAKVCTYDVPIAFRHLIIAVVGLAYFLGSEMDRMIVASHEIESAELLTGYTGQCRDARSSVEQDRLTIMDEIGDQQAKVDAAISVLVRSGMATANLQEAAARGLVVENAGFFRISFLSLGIGGWCVSAHTVCVDYSLGIGIFCMEELFLWLCFFAFLPKDSRAFAAKVPIRIVVAPLMLLDFLFGCDQIPRHIFYHLHSWLFVFLGTLTLVISVAGLGNLLSIPFFGPCLARFILGTGCCRCCHQTAHTARLKVKPPFRTRSKERVEDGMQDSMEGIELTNAGVTQAPPPFYQVDDDSTSTKHQS